jgi:hypothetical protein
MNFWFDAAAWIDAERPLGILMLRDLASYVERTNARTGLPECTPMLSWVIGENGLAKVDWQRIEFQPELPQQTLDRLGYRPQAGGRLEQALSQRSTR